MKGRVDFTAELAAKFKGGQAGISNRRKGYLNHGEVEEIFVDGNSVRIKFVWRAKTDLKQDVHEQKLVNEPNLEYSTNIMFGDVFNIGPGNKGGDDQICIDLEHLTGEMIILYPPNGSKLDPARVEGLRLAPA